MTDTKRIRISWVLCFALGIVFGAALYLITGYFAPAMATGVIAGATLGFIADRDFSPAHLPVSSKVSMGVGTGMIGGYVAGSAFLSESQLPVAMIVCAIRSDAGLGAGWQSKPLW